jgi:hypothetical protein
MGLKYMHHYIKNGKPFQSPSPIFYFAWVYGNGSTTFGMHGTEADYAESCKNDPWQDTEPRNIVEKKLVPEVGQSILSEDDEITVSEFDVAPVVEVEAPVVEPVVEDSQ